MSEPGGPADAPAATSGAPAPEGQRLIRIGLVVFVLACAVFLGLGRLVAPRKQPIPRFAPTSAAAARSDGTFTMTLDARDDAQWAAFSFGSGAATTLDAADLVAKRHILVAPRGAVDLGDVPLASANVPAGAAWIVDPAKNGGWNNVALRRWYAYSYWTHLVKPAATTYAIRRAAGGVAYVRIEGYYCEPDGAGCLTFRYRLE